MIEKCKLDKTFSKIFLKHKSVIQKVSFKTELIQPVSKKLNNQQYRKFNNFF